MTQHPIMLLQRIHQGQDPWVVLPSAGSPTLRNLKKDPKESLLQAFSRFRTSNPYHMWQDKPDDWREILVAGEPFKWVFYPGTRV